jgi:hypothetical protein
MKWKRKEEVGKGRKGVADVGSSAADLGLILKAHKIKNSV